MALFLVNLVVLLSDEIEIDVIVELEVPMSIYEDFDFEALIQETQGMALLFEVEDLTLF